jgi:hypothetical protein
MWALCACALASETLPLSPWQRFGPSDPATQRPFPSMREANSVQAYIDLESNPPPFSLAGVSVQDRVLRTVETAFASGLAVLAAYS